MGSDGASGRPVAELRDGTCEVWWARRTPLPRNLMDLLDDVERRRAASFTRIADRERFVVGCVVTRRVLGTHLSIAPADVVLDRTCPECERPHGRVRLMTAGQPVHISVSHSGERVVVALKIGAPVGVDVETFDPHRDPAELLPHVLTEAEAAPLLRLSPVARAAAFTTYWTRKEAVVKATGDGLRASLSDLAVSAPAQPARLLSWSARPELPRATQLHDLDPGRGYVAALAVLAAKPTAVHELDAESWYPSRWKSPRR
jgi:4'-phosphopantetheinyl transferase